MAGRDVDADDRIEFYCASGGEWAEVLSGRRCTCCVEWVGADAVGRTNDVRQTIRN